MRRPLLVSTLLLLIPGGCGGDDEPIICSSPELAPRCICHDTSPPAGCGPLTGNDSSTADTDQPKFDVLPDTSTTDPTTGGTTGAGTDSGAGDDTGTGTSTGTTRGPD